MKQQILAKYGKKLSDKLLGHIYCDLTQLPISAIRVDDVFNNDRVCFPLVQNQISINKQAMHDAAPQVSEQKSEDVLERLDGQVLNVNTNDWKN